MGKETGNNVSLAERRMKAYDLRLRGRTYRQIGAELGISYTQAMKDVKARIDEVELPGVEEIRKQEVDRLMRYLDALDTRIDNGDDKAIKIALSVSERLTRMLGVDMPTVSVTEHVEKSQMDLDIAELIRAQEARNQLAKELAARKPVDEGAEVTEGVEL